MPAASASQANSLTKIRAPGPATLKWCLPRGSQGRRLPKLSLGELVKEVVSTVGTLASGALDPFRQTMQRKKRRPRLIPHKRGARLPVLLIPGYFQNPANFWWLGPRLEQLGLRNQLEVYNDSMFGSIEVFADTIERQIQRALECTGSTQVNIVGHSMSGLAVRELLRRGYASSRIHRLITLGSPHRGTRWAYVGVGQCCKEMRPGHPFLKRLQAGKERELRQVDAWSIVSNLDLLAPPETACFLHQGSNLYVPNLGHAGYFFSKRVLAILDELL